MAAPALLYLDSARLGLMSPRAQLAAGDFARLAGEESLGLYGDDFFTRGGRPSVGASEFHQPGIRSWAGLRGLLSSLRRLVGTDATAPAWIASRSATFMRLAAAMLCQRCRRILITDTTWPPYRRILQRECRRRGGDLVVLSVRRWILRQGATRESLVQRVAGLYDRRRCDGAFLTAISNDGIRLPVAAIFDAMNSQAALRFAAVDGAQEIGQANVAIPSTLCDFYFAGCHKWLGAYQPMGLAFGGRPETWAFCNRHIRQAIQADTANDPLLCFSSQLVANKLDSVSETANLAPLFTCHGAIRDQPTTAKWRDRVFEQRLQNGLVASDLAQQCGWKPLLTAPEFRSGILLIQPERTQARRRSQHALRGIFGKLGVVVTTYDDAVVRLSMPGRPWLAGDLDQLAEALRRGA